MKWYLALVVAVAVAALVSSLAVAAGYGDFPRTVSNLPGIDGWSFNDGPVRCYVIRSARCSNCDLQPAISCVVLP